MHLPFLCAQARRALYAGVAAHYGRQDADAEADASASAALAALRCGDDVPEATLRALAARHAHAAGCVAELQRSLTAARAVAQLSAAGEEADAARREGRLAAAAAALVAASGDDAAAALAAPGAPRCAAALLAAHSGRCEALTATLTDALLGCVRVTLHAGGAGGDACVQAGSGGEALPALWAGLHALSGANAAAERLGDAVSRALLAPLLLLTPPGGAALTASPAQLAWRAQPAAAGAPRGSVTAFDAACGALSFVCDAALGAAGEGARHAFGAALWPQLAAAAVKHAQASAAAAPQPDGDDAAWDAAAEGVAALEACARAHGVLATQPADACAPLSALLASARADTETAIRGDWLMAARAAALSASKEKDAPRHVGGPWHERAAQMLATPPPPAAAAEPPGALCFPACSVSGGALALAALLDEHVRAASVARAGVPSRARRLRAACDACDALRACGPCARGAELEGAPGAAMLFRNDAHFVAFRLAGGAAACACAGDDAAAALAGTAAALCATGDAVLAAAVESAACDAAAAMDVAGERGFADAAQPRRRAEVERALAGALHAARRFDALAHATLPRAPARAASGAVLSAVGRAAASRVLSCDDISVDDSAALCAVLDAAAAHAGFALDTETDAAAAAAAHAPGWRTLCHVRVVLAASLADIVERAQAGRLCGLTAAELSSLVRAVFSDTGARVDALRRIAAAGEAVKM
jgi:hypothetical protein